MVWNMGFRAKTLMGWFCCGMWMIMIMVWCGERMDRWRKSNGCEKSVVNGRMD